MIFEIERLKHGLENLSFRRRTEITNEFIDSLPKGTRLYQAYFMGKEEKVSVESVTSDLIDVAKAMNDTERTYFLKLARKLLEKKDA